MTMLHRPLRHTISQAGRMLFHVRRRKLYCRWLTMPRAIFRAHERGGRIPF